MIQLLTSSTQHFKCLPRACHVPYCKYMMYICKLIYLCIILKQNTYVQVDKFSQHAQVKRFFGRNVHFVVIYLFRIK